MVLAVPFLMCTPIVGWIADARCGNYRVFRVGASLFFLATVVGCICVLILLNVPPHSIVSRVVSGGISPIVYINYTLYNHENSVCMLQAVIISSST